MDRNTPVVLNAGHEGWRPQVAPSALGRALPSSVKAGPSPGRRRVIALNQSPL